MDPVTATGVANSAITFIEFTYNFLCAVYSIYDDGRPVEHDMLENESLKMRDFSSQLILQQGLSQREGDMAIVSLARQCHFLSDNMVTRLGKTKTKKRHLGNAIKTTIKVICSKDEITRLQKNLEGCRAQLHLQVIVLAR
jgi:hypothetical protein